MNLVRLSGMAAHLIAADENVRARCPACRHMNAFRAVLNQDLYVAPNWILGLRVCTNRDCEAVVYFVVDREAQTLSLLPPETIDFDASNLPKPVLESFEEAIKDHANGCYVSAALMVRKTLELLCDDQKAEGKQLYDRLEALRERVVLPPAFFEGMDDLRLLGNDAAHVDLRDFDDVGEVEARVAISFTQELLKAVYQLSDLVGQLAALKRKQSEETA